MSGRCFSHILFCVYSKELLFTIKDVGIGFRIGSHFVGVLAYANDIVLFAPATGALRFMLKLVDDYCKYL